MQRPWGESGRPVWFELRRKAELERWSRVRVGVGGTLGALGSPERFWARDANMIGVRRIFPTARLAKSGFSRNSLLLWGALEGGGGAQVAWRPALADRKLWTWFLLPPSEPTPRGEALEGGVCFPVPLPRSTPWLPRPSEAGARTSQHPLPPTSSAPLGSPAKMLTEHKGNTENQTLSPAGHAFPHPRTYLTEPLLPPPRGLQCGWQPGAGESQPLLSPAEASG